jgi:hypothetical protein
MLSLAECRQILGPNCDLADSELEAIRNQLYAVAGVAITTRCAPTLKEAGKSPAREATGEKIELKRYWHLSNFKPALRLIPAEDRHEVRERAAIIEFDAGAKRDDAERRALHGYVRRHRDGKNG